MSEPESDPKATLRQLLEDCRRFAPSEPAAETADGGDATVELTGLIERSPRDGFFVLRQRARGAAAGVDLELALADVESWELRFADSAGRRTCTVRLSATSPVRVLRTAAESRSPDASTAESEPAFDPVAAWNRAPWRREPPAQQPQPTSAAPAGYYYYPQDPRYYPQVPQARPAGATVPIDPRTGLPDPRFYRHDPTGGRS